MFNWSVLITNNSSGDCRCRKTWANCCHCEFMVTACSAEQACDMPLLWPTEAGQTQLAGSATARAPSEKSPM